MLPRTVLATCVASIFITAVGGPLPNQPLRQTPSANAAQDKTAPDNNTTAEAEVAMAWPQEGGARFLSGRFLSQQKPLLPLWTSSYQRYRQPHAVWLDQDSSVGSNMGRLHMALALAAQQRQVPELVTYFIPLRDLGQSSEGGFASWEDYFAEHALITSALGRFVQQTGLAPVVYLEPDALGHALDYLKKRGEDAEARRIYQQRTRALRQLVQQYRQAGACVMLDAAHSGWFGYDDANIARIASALQDAGVAQAHGLVTNVSNRQALLPSGIDSVSPGPRYGYESGYLQALLQKIQAAVSPGFVVTVDTSRNGRERSHFQNRVYQLAADGRLLDNAQPGTGRWVGHWRQHGDTADDLQLLPFFGPPKLLERLVGKEKYTWQAESKTLTAPPWLDPLGDVQPGPVPTDAPPEAFVRGLPAGVVARFRYVKPPDECDGSLSCPPGWSKSKTEVDTALLNEPARTFKKIVK